MTRWLNYFSTLLLGFGVMLSCKNSEECERSRMGVAKIWYRVKDGATQRRNRQEIATSSDSSRDKWTRIAKQAELVASSFETEQITWNAAAKGKKQLQQDTAELADSQDPSIQSFARLLEEANSKIAEFEKACR
jgi:hypothetical protein